MNSLEVEKAEAPTDKNHTATIPLFKNILIDCLGCLLEVGVTIEDDDSKGSKQSREKMGCCPMVQRTDRADGLLLHLAAAACRDDAESRRSMHDDGGLMLGDGSID